MKRAAEHARGGVASGSARLRLQLSFFLQRRRVRDTLCRAAHGAARRWRSCWTCCADRTPRDSHGSSRCKCHVDVRLMFMCSCLMFMSCSCSCCHDSSHVRLLYTVREYARTRRYGPVRTVPYLILEAGNVGTYLCWMSCLVWCIREAYRTVPYVPYLLYGTVYTCPCTVYCTVGGGLSLPPPLPVVPTHTLSPLARSARLAQALM